MRLWMKCPVLSPSVKLVEPAHVMFDTCLTSALPRPATLARAPDLAEPRQARRLPSRKCPNCS